MNNTNNDNNSNGVGPYRATSNMNTYIDTPNANFNGMMNVNIQSGTTNSSNHGNNVINSNNNICDSVGHIPKSVVANPVVVIIEATWNIEYLNDSLTFPYMSNVLTVIIPVNTAIINIYHLSSSLLKICLK